MANYVFPPAQQTSLPIRGREALFPVRRVYCIGRNYADHAVEMGHNPDREPPFFFQKNPNNLYVGADFPYPAQSGEVQYEVELVIALHSGGVNIMPDDALKHVYGYALGLDMTCRDLQTQMKKMGRPWEVGKAFEMSAPVTPIVPAEELGHLSVGSITLEVDGDMRQQGDLKQMIWKPAEMIAYLSKYYQLAAGDMIMTGTPAGVGSIKKGNVMLGKIEGLAELSVRVV